MIWSNVVVEGYCFADSKDDKYPCGHTAPSSFCLENGHCPHFGYAESTERDAAFFVPLRLIVKDKMRSIGESLYWKLRWWLWVKWHYNPNWLEKIPIAEDTTWEEDQERCNLLFPGWFAETEKEAHHD